MARTKQTKAKARKALKALEASIDSDEDVSQVMNGVITGQWTDSDIEEVQEGTDMSHSPVLQQTTMPEPASAPRENTQIVKHAPPRPLATRLWHM